MTTASVKTPLLVVVTGMPASGKTTVARALSRHLGLPLIAKDEIKERLYDTLGIGDVEWSGRLGQASFALIFSFAQSLLEAGTSTIVEANFFRRSEQQFSALPDHRIVQIHCYAPLDMLVERYADRTRHAGHQDDLTVNDLGARFESGAHSPLDLPGELIAIDTSRPVDDALIARQVGRQL